MREVVLTSGEHHLTGTVVPGDAEAADAPAVLLVHGLGSDRQANVERATALARTMGATCLAIDLAGHGGSSGALSAMTPRQNLRDVLTAYDALADEPGVDPGRIGLCAASYGAYLAVLAANRRPVARLLLRAPALYPDDCLDARLGQRRAGGPHESARFLAGFARITGPVLVVASEHDEVIGPEVIEAYLSARPRTNRRLLPGASHALTDPAWRAQFRRILLDFFAPLAR